MPIAETAHGLFFTVAAGEQNRDVGPDRAQAPQRLFAAHHRHGPIENDQRSGGYGIAEQIDAFLAIAGNQHTIPVLFQSIFRHSANDFFVVDDEDGSPRLFWFAPAAVFHHRKDHLEGAALSWSA